LLPQAAKRKLTLMFFLSLFNALIDVAGIALLVFLFHYVTTNDLLITTNLVITGSVLLVGFFIIKNSITTYLTRLQSQFAFNQAQVQSQKVFQNIYSQDELFFRKKETGALVSDMMYVPSAFANGVILGYITLLTELSVLILMFIFLAISSLYISLLVIIFVGPTALVSYMSIKNRIEALGKKRNANVKRAQDALIQSIHAHNDAILYDRERYFENFFGKYQQEISNTDAKVFTLNTVPARMMEIFAVLAFCLIYGYNKITGKNSLPFDITLFVAAAFRMLPSVNRVLGSLLRIKNHWFSVDVLLKYQSKEKEPASKVSTIFNNEIVLKNLEFTFDSHQVCKIDNFRIGKGSSIGIYGNTGAGKSTFIQLLLQLIPADKGEIYVDGLIINKDAKKRYSDLFAYIRQDVFILNASLFENISLGGPEETDMNKVNGIIEELELGKIQHLFADSAAKTGEAGNKLSGGQKKLLALARALYFDKPILVLDEIFASLDLNSVEQVLIILKREQSKGKTIIMVSHQKNVFEICDHIYEYKNGNLTLNN
jgi:ABC-type multidrug transport system fused ATPase/permease subunit